MSILGSNGKNATPGPMCIYQLVSGLFFYSEEPIKENDSSFVFDGDKTLAISIHPKGKGMADLGIVKLSETEFGPKRICIQKSSIIMITDCGRPEVIKKAKEALSGIMLAGPGVN